MSNAGAALAYAAAISLATFSAFAWDKRCARRGDWRISEQTLLSLVALGGGLGALAAQSFLRHKTRKQPFVSILYTLIALQVAVGLAVFIPGLRLLLWNALKPLVG